MVGKIENRRTDGRGRLLRAIAPLQRDDTERNIADCFEAVVRQWASRPAVVGESGTLTYAELNAWANRAARAIRAQPGAVGGIAALLVGHGPDALAAVMGAVKSGTPFVALDPTFPQRRLLELIDDSGAGVLLFDGKHAAAAELLARSRRMARISLGDVRGIGSAENLGLPIPPDHPSYLVYTSGSTGKPKGVVTTHRYRVSNQLDLARRIGLTERDRLTWLHSLAFAASASELFTALMCGATLYPVDLREVGFRGLAECLHENGITVLQWIPSAFRRFGASIPAGACFPDLRAILLGSEPVTAREVQLYRELTAEGCLLANRYGATEVGYSHYYFIDRGTPVATGIVPVGFPTSHRDATIHGENGEPVAAGEPGEIWVRSEYLASGYWHDPERTAERFRPGRYPEERSYGTGDLGQLDADGCLHHLGRRDQQVKVNGFRVELADVELALTVLPGVDDAVAAAVLDPEGEQRLVGYVVMRDGHEQDLSCLRQLLAERLPSYLLPSVILYIDAVPLTATGKVYRGGLPIPDWNAPVLAGGAPPANALESALLEIWMEVLHRDVMGVDQDFFDLGGDSLQATRMINRVQEWTSQPVSPMIAWDAPTIRILAKRLAERYPELAPSVAGRSAEKSEVAGPPSATD